ncbi:MAG: hypothetical protein ACTSRS_07525 [Candidatus Helarchaeota archaeon]
MIPDFKTFIEKISKKSRFDRPRLREIYQKHLLIEKGHHYSRYEREFTAKWNGWVRQNSPLDVSKFFIQNGENLFRGWLREFSPFQTGNERLLIGVRGGGTPEDIIIHLFYKFSIEELEYMDCILEKHQITDLTRKSALTRLFLESFLSLKPIISKALGYKYALMLEEAKFLKKERGRILFLEIVARPED